MTRGKYTPFLKSEEEKHQEVHDHNQTKAQPHNWYLEHVLGLELEKIWASLSSWSCYL